MQLSQFLQMRCTVAQTTAPRTITFSSLSSLSKSMLASDADQKKSLPVWQWISVDLACWSAQWSLLNPWQARPYRCQAEITDPIAPARKLPEFRGIEPIWNKFPVKMDLIFNLSSRQCCVFDKERPRPQNWLSLSRFAPNGEKHRLANNSWVFTSQQALKSAQNFHHTWPKNQRLPSIKFHQISTRGGNFCRRQLRQTNFRDYGFTTSHLTPVRGGCGWCRNLQGR